MSDMDYSTLSKEQQNLYLFERQKKLLDTFLEHHAITQEQYMKSLSCLKEKMHITEVNHETE